MMMMINGISYDMLIIMMVGTTYIKEMDVSYITHHTSIII